MLEYYASNQNYLWKYMYVNIWIMHIDTERLMHFCVYIH